MISASTNTAFDRLCEIGELHDAMDLLNELEGRLSSGVDLCGTPITEQDRAFLARAIEESKARVARARARCAKL